MGLRGGGNASAQGMHQRRGCIGAGVLRPGALHPAAGTGLPRAKRPCLGLGEPLVPCPPGDPRGEVVSMQLGVPPRARA